MEVSIDDNMNMFDIELRMDMEIEIPPIPLRLGDMILKVRHRVGNSVHKNCYYDSVYSVDAMRRICVAMRDRYHWISATESVFLATDNAREHGTDECIRQYTSILKDEFNIVIIL